MNLRESKATWLLPFTKPEEVGVYRGGGVPIPRSISTFGWSGAASTTFFVNLQEELFAICFTQVFLNEWIGNDHHEQFERLVYESLI